MQVGTDDIMIGENQTLIYIYQCLDALPQVTGKGMLQKENINYASMG